MTAAEADANEREFVRACKRWHLELLKEKEGIVPPCAGYSRPEPHEGAGK